MKPPIKVIVFDFGGVLIDWNPRYLYKKIFSNEGEMEWFLTNICTDGWNAQQDKGHEFEKAIASLTELHPKFQNEIEAYYKRWPEMLRGEINETVEVLLELKDKNYRIYGLTNWSGETFPIALERFEFLRIFDGIIVSGDEKMAKPDREIFQLLLNRYNLTPEHCLFIDDNADNIKTANGLGFYTIHFRSPQQLKEEMKKLID